jgi:hypothetical protein
MLRSGVQLVSQGACQPHGAGNAGCLIAKPFLIQSLGARPAALAGILIIADVSHGVSMRNIETSCETGKKKPGAGSAGQDDMVPF